MKITDLKNKFIDSTIVLVGNGPSLSMEDLNVLEEKKILSFGVNKIFLAYDQTKWRPDFYASSDHAIVEDIKESFKKNIPKYTFVPQSASQYYNDTLLQDKISFINHLSRSNMGYQRSFSKDISQVSYGGYTVLYFALQIIYYMGFKKVILLGLDHNYSYAKVEPVNQTSHNGRMILHKEGSNHFHPEYFQQESLVGDFYLPEVEESFRIAKDTFEADGREIVNCSRTSKLEVFRKGIFENEI